MNNQLNQEKYKFTNENQQHEVEILKMIKEDVTESNLIRFYNDSKKYFQNVK